MIITIDGPSGSGKSTVARMLAAKLKMVHLNSGMLYRIVATRYRQMNAVTETVDRDSIVECLEKMQLGFSLVGSRLLWMLDGEEVAKELLQQEGIGHLASEIAVFPQVRERVNRLQHEVALGYDVVVEGRDIGTNVFPNATVKFYLIADPRVRAERRFAELKILHPDVKYEFSEVLKDVLRRDERDISRKIAPLKKPLDAFEIDSTGFNIKQVIREMTFYVRRAQKRTVVRPFWLKLLGEGHSHGTLFYRICFSFSRLFFKCFFRLTVSGQENYPQGKAAIIAPNHLSFLDPPTVGVSCPQEVNFLAIDYLFRVPLFGACIRRLNCIPISGNVQDTTSIKNVIRSLAAGEQVMIFPEGTRNTEDRIAPLKRGVAVIATKVPCLIVPVLVKGTHEAWPRGRAFFKPFKHLHVAFGPPIDARLIVQEAGSAKEARERINHELQAALEALHAKHHCRK
ncbi:MAG: cytidylate kinase [Chlamydiae bacterium RIFCSPHIGHO2_12_FULL_49_11]|nr:MAG: cytidylate kinase [Chlamydiae bacterium RIFCSPHIGHO2_12_FULL_49_11]